VWFDMGRSLKNESIREGDPIFGPQTIRRLHHR